MQPRYYYSSRDKSRILKSNAQPPEEPQRRRHSHRRRSFTVLFLIFLIISALGVNHFIGSSRADAPALSSKTVPTTVASSKSTATKAVVAPATPNPCASNTLSQLVLVSIGARHLYACQASQEVYSSAVVTGISYLAADLTPVGTYHIYAKETNQVLTGCDSTGCWDDHVSYWMPFLDNQYGAYGFHDATWRSPDDFGNISPDSADASHGCVECPLATAQWLYGWTEVGTTVTIES